MKVLMVVEQLRREVPGGIGTYARGLLQGLSSMGEDAPAVTLHASRLHRSGGESGPDPIGQLGWPVRTSALPGPLLTRAWDLGAQKAPAGFDVVHQVSLAGPAPAAGERTVVTIHDLVWREEPSTFPARGRRWHEAALARALRRADRFIVPSKRTASALVDAGAAPGRVDVVEEGSDHLPPPDREAARLLLSSRNVEGPYLLTVSTLEPRKNLHRLLAAYSSVRELLPEPWPLVVAGPQGWGDAVAQREGVVLTGVVEDAVLAALYEGARCVAYVPLAEGFGLPALEAMSLGAPVVASPVPSVGGAAIVVDPTDIASISAGLVQACTDEGARGQLSREGSKRAAALTWGETARRHAEIWAQASRSVADGSYPRLEGERAGARRLGGHLVRSGPGGSHLARARREPRPQGPVRVSLDVSAVPEHPAGAGRYTVELVRALSLREDVALTLISRHDDEGRWTEIGNGASVVAAAPSNRPARLAWEQTSLALRLRHLGIDLHHGPHYTMPEISALPKVVTVHDVTFFDHPEWHERSKAVFFRRAIRVAAKRADRIVCVSETTAARLKSLLRPVAPIEVIPHGVDARQFCPVEPSSGYDSSALSGLGVQRPYVAFVGTIEPRKDLPTLVRAFDRISSAHPDLSLVLAGMPGWGGDELSRSISRAARPGRIRRIGYVPDEAIPSLMRQAAAVVYPAIEEGFGMPALEALACGAPVVTTSGSAMEEIVGGSALLVPPGDAGALAGAMDMVIRKDEGLRARRERGLEVAARHTWEASAERHASVYASLRDETARRR